MKTALIIVILLCSLLLGGLAFGQITTTGATAAATFPANETLVPVTEKELAEIKRLEKKIADLNKEESIYKGKIEQIMKAARKRIK